MNIPFAPLSESAHRGLASRIPVVIIGGGTAGAALALSLGRRGIETMVVDRGKPTALRVGEHLTPRALEQLERLGVPRQALIGVHQPSYGVSSAWGETTLVERTYLFDPVGIGFHLERAEFDRMLTDRAQRANCDWVTGTVTQFSRDQHGYRLEVDSPIGTQDVHCSVLVDATGRSAFVARKLGIGRKVYDRLVGVTAFVDRPNSGHLHHIALIESDRTGWFYSAPLPNARIVVTYFTDADYLAKLGNRDQFFAQALAGSTHTRQQLNGLETAKDTFVRPACTELLARIAGPNWLAIGDAASSQDPLSSSGIARCLDDALDAAEAVVAFLAGDQTALDQYGTSRRRHFIRYLAQRAMYYGLETRFGSSEFWTRRRATTSAAAITLHPMMRLRPRPEGLVTVDLVPSEAGIDQHELYQLAQATPLAHELVRVYCEQFQATSHHVISAIQTMLDQKYLEARSE